MPKNKRFSIYNSKLIKPKAHIPINLPSIFDSRKHACSFGVGERSYESMIRNAKYFFLLKYLKNRSIPGPNAYF